MHHTTRRILPHAIPTTCGIQKICSPNKTMWLIAFAGELGDVVSRLLPHGILDTSEDTQVGDFPQKSGLVNFSLFVQVCRGSLGSPVSSRNYFLNPENYVLNPGNYFLNPGNYFFLSNPGNYFFNPGNFFYLRNYFLTWVLNPETMYKTRIVFTNPSRGTRIAVNHLKFRNCPRSHGLSKRERLLAQAFFILFRSVFFDSPHLRISHCFFHTSQL